MFVLPLPVGPVTSTMPHGFLTSRRNRVERVGLEAERAHVELAAPRGRAGASTTFSPKSVGRIDTRKSMSRLRPRSTNRALMRPSCGSRFSAMSSRAMILMRETIGSRNLMAGVITDVQLAVDAEADPHVLLVRLDVDVARALLNGRQHQRVDQLDDRRFAALLLERRRVDLLGVGDDLEVVVVRAELLERTRWPGPTPSRSTAGFSAFAP